MDQRIIISLCILVVWARAQNDGIMFGGEADLQPAFCDVTYQWVCANGECIAQYDVCDGVTQCEDGSDESNCDQPELKQQRPQQPQQPGRQVHLQPKPNATTPSALPTTTSSNGLSLRLAALGLFLLVGLAAGVHYMCKRRKTNNNRNIRKGESLLDDEDDLLISQMYA
uniref:Basement membrane-specific heparan sulfate proteoglycan core protein n=1 Tax=Bursaphelenchus xylophilus TaxID=6326 RepID=A0A1I7RL49_BURXY